MFPDVDNIEDKSEPRQETHHSNKVEENKANI